MLYAFPRNQHNKNKGIRAFRPLEVCGAVFGDAVVDGAHHLNELSLGLVLADDLVLAEEVRRDGDERVLGPALEPVHRAAGYQAGELQRTVPELLADLSQQAVNVIRQRPHRRAHYRGGLDLILYMVPWANTSRSETRLLYPIIPFRNTMLYTTFQFGGAPQNCFCPLGILIPL